jgi:predicted metal-dependent phosphoesterase TrpH
MALKIDFHIHTSEDPADNIKYDARRLIDRAAELRFDAIAITNHDMRTYNEKLAAYATQRGILLLPGMEAHFSGYHILLINPPFRKQPRDRTFRDLADLPSEEMLIIAPHPYFPSIKSLGEETLSNIHLFDALELCQYHNPLIDFNAQASRLSKKFSIPMVATSDSHHIWQFGRSFCLVEAEKNCASIIEAVKKGRLENISPPLSLIQMTRNFSKFFLSMRFFKGLRKHSRVFIKRRLK